MNDMYEEIKQILLQHKGKARAIKSKNISSRIGLPMEDTQKISRAAIWYTAEKYGLPLVACKNGYFIAETDDEIDEYNANIQHRIDGMEKTRQMVNRNYWEARR